jgi:hypothetical protein
MRSGSAECSDAVRPARVGKTTHAKEVPGAFQENTTWPVIAVSSSRRPLFAQATSVLLCGRKTGAKKAWNLRQGHSARLSGE